VYLVLYIVYLCYGNTLSNISHFAKHYQYRSYVVLKQKQIIIVYFISEKKEMWPYHVMSITMAFHSCTVLCVVSMYDTSGELYSTKH